MTDEMPETVFVTALADEFGPRKAYSHCGSWPSARTEYLRSDVAHARIEAQAALIAELTEAHKRNSRLLGLVCSDLQGRVESGKLAAVYSCKERSDAALSRAEEAQK